MFLSRLKRFHRTLDPIHNILFAGLNQSWCSTDKLNVLHYIFYWNLCIIFFVNTNVNVSVSFKTCVYVLYVQSISHRTFKMLRTFTKHLFDL